MLLLLESAEILLDLMAENWVRQAYYEGKWINYMSVMFKAEKMFSKSTQSIQRLGNLLFYASVSLTSFCFSIFLQKVRFPDVYL